MISRHPVGRYIDEVMRAHKWTPREICRPNGISSMTFWYIRQGFYRPRLATFLKIVVALKPTPEEWEQFILLKLAYYDKQTNLTRFYTRASGIKIA